MVLLEMNDESCWLANNCPNLANLLLLCLLLLLFLPLLLPLLPLHLIIFLG